MKKEQISAGYTVLLQRIICVFAVLILVSIMFLLKNIKLDTTAWAILFCILILTILSVWRILQFADIYVAGNKIICRKIIGKRIADLRTIDSLNEGVSSLNYCILFNDGSKIYFQISRSDILKRFNTWGNNEITQNLKDKLKLINKA